MNKLKKFKESPEGVSPLCAGKIFSKKGNKEASIRTSLIGGKGVIREDRSEVSQTITPKVFGGTDEQEESE